MHTQFGCLSAPIGAGVVNAHDGDNWRGEVDESQTDDAVSLVGADKQLKRFKYNFN